MWLKCNVWQDNLKMEIAATGCTTQRTSMKGRWMIGLFYHTIKIHVYTMLVREYNSGRHLLLPPGVCVSILLVCRRHAGAGQQLSICTHCFILAASRFPGRRRRCRDPTGRRMLRKLQWTGKLNEHLYLRFILVGKPFHVYTIIKKESYCFQNIFELNISIIGKW